MIDFDTAAEQDEQDALDALTPAQEDTHTPEDEAFYVQWIMPGYVEDILAEQPEVVPDDDPYFDLEHEADRAQDRWERSFWRD